MHEFTITDIAYGLHNTAFEMHCYRADFNGNIPKQPEDILLQRQKLSGLSGLNG